MAEWFTLIAGEQTGPISTDVLRKLVQFNKMADGDLAWKEGETQKISAARLKELLKFFYETESGQVNGPIFGAELRDAALNGVMRPSTRLKENDSDWVIAKSVPGLFDKGGNALPHKQSKPVTAIDREELLRASAPEVTSTKSPYVVDLGLEKREELETAEFKPILEPKPIEVERVPLAEPIPTAEPVKHPPRAEPIPSAEPVKVVNDTSSSRIVRDNTSRHTDPQPQERGYRSLAVVALVSLITIAVVIPIALFMSEDTAPILDVDELSEFEGNDQPAVSSQNQPVFSNNKVLFENWDKLIQKAKQRVPQAQMAYADDPGPNAYEGAELGLSIQFETDDIRKTDSARYPLIGVCVLQVTEAVGGLSTTLKMRVSFVPDEQGWRFHECEEETIATSYRRQKMLIDKGFFSTKVKATYKYLAALFDMPILKPE